MKWLVVPDRPTIYCDINIVLVYCPALIDDDHERCVCLKPSVGDLMDFTRNTASCLSPNVWV